MASNYLFRLGRIKGKNGIEKALKHNRRKLPEERSHIDPTRSVLNYSLYGEGNPKDIALHAKFVMFKAGIATPRKNGVMGVEIIFSLPINRHQQDTRPFFQDCLSWVQRTLPGELLAFDVHLDEAAPHAHAVILPLVNGRMQGRDMIGGIGNMNRLRKTWFNDVGRHYGLNQGNAKLSKQDKNMLARAVIKTITNDPVQQSTLWPLIHDVIHSNPGPYAQHLGLTHQPSKRKGKSFLQIMTSTGHGKE